MAFMTITEALAEIKLAKAKVAKKQEFILAHLTRPENMVDRLGDSPSILLQEIQAVSDLAERIVEIRTAIAKANAETVVLVEDETRTIAGWLIWRRESWPIAKSLFEGIESKLRNRHQDRSQPAGVFILNQVKSGVELVLHVDPREIFKTAQRLTDLYERLDGKLSLINALTVIEVPD